MLNFSIRIKSRYKCPCYNLFKLLLFSLLLVLNSFSTTNAQNDLSAKILVIDSVYAQSLSTTWKPIEKSFFILDSTLTPPSTFKEFKNLNENSLFRQINNNRISLQLNQSSWVKMNIKNESLITLDLVISIKSSQSDIFIIADDEIQQKYAGDFYPRSLWNTETTFQHLYNPYIVSIHLKPNEKKDVIVKLGPFIKIKETNIQLTQKAHAYKNLSFQYLNRNLIQGFCMGMLCIMLIYNLLTFFASERDYIYLLNSLYTFSLVGWFFTTSELDRLIFIAEYPLATELVRVTSGVGIGVFYVLYSQAVIGKQNIPEYLNKLIKYFLYMEIISVFAINALTCLFMWFNISNMILIRSIFPPTGLLAIVVSVLFIIHMFKLGTKLSNVLAISSCFVLLAAVLAVFGDFIFLMGDSSNSLKTTNSYYALIIEFAFIIQIILFGFASGIRAKELEKEKVQLEEINSIKSQFFTNISHEIRTPLTLVMSPLKQVISELKNKTHSTLLETSYKSANRMLNLINQILDLSKLEAKSMQLNISSINIAALFKESLAMFNSSGDQRNIKLLFKSSSPEIMVYGDQDKMRKIALNLISNAIKFNKENGTVAIHIEEHTDVVKIIVRDEGIGIEKKELEHIFNRFYQVDTLSLNSNSSSGIGLALVKELVELHHGTLTVESELNKGTVFTFWLKKGTSHFKGIPISKNKLSEKSAAKTSLQNITIEKTPISNITNSELPIILVIEDHYELLNYIKTLLSAHYQVLSAYNGAMGIDKAIKVVPDLIVSDVMMPDKSGIVVCNTLKNDERTSHIPIILLTAKVDIEAKIEGLGMGADDYIAKPFDHQELRIRIKNLLDQRFVLRQKFKNELQFVPDDISTNNTDKVFVQKLLKVVHTNLSSESFGVNELALEMAMSRTQLNRKLRDLLDLSTNKFIQSCRLNKALELLKKQGSNVSQVAHVTGFSSDAYFIKCFKEHFGSTPGKYFSQK
ncbi:hypothetical protein MHTCC0001_17010 [Flavobacteriaceae bacterium MHTCC 0001]